MSAPRVLPTSPAGWSPQPSTQSARYPRVSEWAAHLQGEAVIRLPGIGTGSAHAATPSPRATDPAASSDVNNAAESGGRHQLQQQQQRVGSGTSLLPSITSRTTPGTTNHPSAQGLDGRTKFERLSPLGLIRRDTAYMCVYMNMYTYMYYIYIHIYIYTCPYCV